MNISDIKTVEELSTIIGTLQSNWVYLETRLTSTSFDGDSFSTTAKTKIDLSSEFGAPANIKAALFDVRIRDSGAGSTDCVLRLGPTVTTDRGLAMSCLPANDRWNRGCLVVPCDSGGDVYYQIDASGSGTFDVVLRIWGYKL